MEWLRIFVARVQGFFGKRNAEVEPDAEVRAHLEMLTGRKYSPRHESNGASPRGSA
jgi:hypothetical protein